MWKRGGLGLKRWWFTVYGVNYWKRCGIQRKTSMDLPASSRRRKTTDPGRHVLDLRIDELCSCNSASVSFVRTVSLLIWKFWMSRSGSELGFIILSHHFQFYFRTRTRCLFTCWWWLVQLSVCRRLTGYSLVLRNRIWSIQCSCRSHVKWCCSHAYMHPALLTRNEAETRSREAEFGRGEWEIEAVLFFATS